MIEAEWWDYETIDELADAVAGDVAFIIESAIEARNASLIAVPGGRTGPAIFPKLVAQALPWKRVTIIPTDDRLVPMDSELSNVRAIAKAAEANDYKLSTFVLGVIRSDAFQMKRAEPATTTDAVAAPVRD